MKENTYYATGRRKEAVARVWLTPGTGKIEVNGKPLLEYFKRETLKMLVEQPLEVTDTLGKYDIYAKIHGGGLSGQAGALRLGISRSLVKVNEDLRQKLRQGGFLTRDPRVVERKKYGQPKARKRFQFSKR
ncbi:30S ribosomal protein S9 [candidate division KSB1 bacterium]|nr:30S ribosomal protein S9 [bacterium]RKY78138.1 MAG: 30S ribosomal protein S9 [candidate division KSB1 bacterium]RKY85966.1 MAG: 30S ribosomal protein S9 [candidate division KSB1 bacterium]RKY88742.1 MAG: 30S ribosomal protein S9 [candidate division KSB1 bacterium]RKY89102.1 MAG: 30S ribosomal protein S9 [candidate division KSB1 bacterium]